MNSFVLPSSEAAPIQGTITIPSRRIAPQPGPHPIIPTPVVDPGAGPAPVPSTSLKPAYTRRVPPPTAGIPPPLRIPSSMRSLFESAVDTEKMRNFSAERVSSFFLSSNKIGSSMQAPPPKISSKTATPSDILYGEVTFIFVPEGSVDFVLWSELCLMIILSAEEHSNYFITGLFSWYALIDRSLIVDGVLTNAFRQYSTEIVVVALKMDQFLSICNVSKGWAQRIASKTPKNTPKLAPGPIGDHSYEYLARIYKPKVVIPPIIGTNRAYYAYMGVILCTMVKRITTDHGPIWLEARIRAFNASFGGVEQNAAKYFRAADLPSVKSCSIFHGMCSSMHKVRHTVYCSLFALASGGGDPRVMSGLVLKFSRGAEMTHLVLINDFIVCQNPFIMYLDILRNEFKRLMDAYAQIDKAATLTDTWAYVKILTEENVLQATVRTNFALLTSIAAEIGQKFLPSLQNYAGSVALSNEDQRKKDAVMRLYDQYTLEAEGNMFRSDLPLMETSQAIGAIGNRIAETLGRSDEHI